MSQLERKKRTRFKLKKVSSRKRLTVFRSNNHLYAQIINDEQGTTLACVSSLEKSFQNKKNKSKKIMKFLFYQKMKKIKLILYGAQQVRM